MRCTLALALAERGFSGWSFPLVITVSKVVRRRLGASALACWEGARGGAFPPPHMYSHAVVENTTQYLYDFGWCLTKPSSSRKAGTEANRCVLLVVCRFPSVAARVSSVVRPGVLKRRMWSVPCVEVSACERSPRRGRKARALHDGDLRSVALGAALYRGRAWLVSLVLQFPGHRISVFRWPGRLH